MSKKIEWKEDAEVVGIAMEVMSKFEEMFSGLDIKKIRFIRILDKKADKINEVKAVGFPFNIDNSYVYYFMTNNLKWKLLNDQQKNLAVMNGLYTIAEGGTDESSVNYGTKRKKDIEDYSIVLAAAGGRYDWQTPGASDLPNILGEEKEQKGDSEND